MISSLLLLITIIWIMAWVILSKIIMTLGKVLRNIFGIEFGIEKDWEEIEETISDEYTKTLDIKFASIGGFIMGLYGFLLYILKPQIIVDMCISGIIGTIGGAIGGIAIRMYSLIFRELRMIDNYIVGFNLYWITGGISGIAGLILILTTLLLSRIIFSFLTFRKEHLEGSFYFILIISTVLVSGIIVSIFVPKVINTITIKFIRVMDWIILEFIYQPIVSMRFEKIICNHCYRLTEPLKANYEMGIRQCEHCNEMVENTKDKGKVIIVFGEFLIEKEEKNKRLFLFKNTDFREKEASIDVSEIYIDVNSCNQELLKHFINYITKYKPKYEIDSIPIYICGDINNLDPNLAWLLTNLFNNIKNVKK